MMAKTYISEIAINNEVLVNREILPNPKTDPKEMFQTSWSHKIIDRNEHNNFILFEGQHCVPDINTEELF